MEERRRSARITLGHADVATLPTIQNVQVLDISVIGVMLHLSRPIDPGTRGCLRLNLWGSPFSADVEVRRVSPVSENGRDLGYRVGARFVGITPEHRHLIERFASQ
jgi:PilZ domain